MLSCCLLLLTMLPAAAFAVPEGSWSDYAANGFSGGDGSQEAPYIIATAEELAYLAVSSDTQGKFFRLTANVDLSAHVWQPIGSTVAFGGYFDGNGMTVSGVQGALFAAITAPEANGVPLVQNLTISGTVTSADTGVNQYTGLLAGSVNGVSGSQAAVISNVAVSGTVHTAGGYNTARGGMIGFAQNVTITGCSANVTIDGLEGSLGRSLGALVGELSNGTISNCVTYGSVHGANSIGGMVGLMKNGSTAVSSTANASVRSNSSEVGGFVGTLNVGCSVTDSIATGDVSHYNSKSSPYEGGFAGRNNGTITHCAAFGTVTEEVNRGYPAGGFVGYADLNGVTQDCYYDTEKNPQWEGIGKAVNNGSGLSNDITPSQDACVDYFGEHNTQLVGAVPPTETTPGYTGDEVCMVCHKTIVTGQEIPALGHQTQLQGQKDPTCTEAGYTGDLVCTLCNEVVEKGEVIPALGHSFENGVCTRCGAKDPDYAEPTNPTVPSEPTEPSGSTQPTESDEPTQKPTETTPPTDPEGPAQTGSSTPVELLTLLLLASAAGVALLAEKRRSL